MQQKLLNENNPIGNYGTDIVFRIQDKLNNLILYYNFKIRLIIRYAIPWSEDILLYQNVSHITTLDYQPHNCVHPKITTISPDDLGKSFGRKQHHYLMQ